MVFNNQISSQGQWCTPVLPTLWRQKEQIIKVTLGYTVRLRLAWARKPDLKKLKMEKKNVKMTKSNYHVFFVSARRFVSEETIVYALMTWDLFPLLTTAF